MVKSYIKAVLIIIVLFFLVTFGIKNSTSVNISYYFGLFEASVPLYAMVYVCLILGVIIGMLIGLTGRFAVKKRLRASEKAYNEICAELEILRSKTATPVYNENIYVPISQPVADDNDNNNDEIKHISDAY